MGRRRAARSSQSHHNKTTKLTDHHAESNSCEQKSLNDVKATVPVSSTKGHEAEDNDDDDDKDIGNTSLFFSHINHMCPLNMIEILNIGPLYGSMIVTIAAISSFAVGLVMSPLRLTLMYHISFIENSVQMITVICPRNPVLEWCHQ